MGQAEIYICPSRDAVCLWRGTQTARAAQFVDTALEHNMADSPIVPLTLAGRHFSIMPCPSHLQYQCTSSRCDETATHRVLSRATASTEWLCDAHTLAWARLQHADVAGVAAAPSL